MIDAMVHGEECEVDPNPKWVRKTLAGLRPGQGWDSFVCLMRDRGKSQFNVLCEADGFALEWFLANEDKRLIAFRRGGEWKYQPGPRKDFDWGPQKQNDKQIHGSRFTLEQAATYVDQFVTGKKEFAGLAWVELSPEAKDLRKILTNQAATFFLVLLSLIAVAALVFWAQI